MVIDSSALLAILQNESERRTFNEAIEAADARRMSVASFVEVSIVVETRFGAAGQRDLDQYIERARIELMPVDIEQSQVARRAYSCYGKGRHAAALNFGDCFAYALTTVLGEPLLFKGDDFTKTDVAQYRGGTDA